MGHGEKNRNANLLEGHPPLLNSLCQITLYMRLSSYDSQINPIELSDDPED